MKISMSGNILKSQRKSEHLKKMEAVNKMLAIKKEESRKTPKKTSSKKMIAPENKMIKAKDIENK